MDKEIIKARIADILKYDCYGSGIKFVDRSEDGLEINLNCYALTATAAEKIATLARETRRSCIFTIQSVADPKLQIRL